MKNLFKICIGVVVTTCTLSTAGCKSPKVDGSVDDNEITAADIVKAPPAPSFGGKRAMIKATIYRTDGNYDNNVTASYNSATGQFISYPAPTDVNALTSCPLHLVDGWLLDRRGGIGVNTVFLRWTYSEYSKLKQAPSLAELRSAIIEGARVTDVRVLPMSSFDAQRDTAAINRMILSGEIPAAD